MCAGMVFCYRICYRRANAASIRAAASSCSCSTACA
jgi:hypothetical protein